MVEEKERPLGITILAVLGFLSGALGVIIGILMLAGGGMFAAMYGHDAAMAGGIFAAGGVFAIVISLLVFAVAWGLWTGKSWAWWIEVILSALGVLSILSFNAAGFVDAIIAAIILWYLFKPHVKDFFGVQVSFST